MGSVILDRWLRIFVILTALAEVKSAFAADIAEPVIVKILLPKQASGEKPPGQ